MRQNLVDLQKLKALPWTYLGFKKRQKSWQPSIGCHGFVRFILIFFKWCFLYSL